MDPCIVCRHQITEHDFMSVDGPWTCNIWLEEQDDWCPCSGYTGLTGTNSRNLNFELVL